MGREFDVVALAEDNAQAGRGTGGHDLRRVRNELDQLADDADIRHLAKGRRVQLARQQTQRHTGLPRYLRS